MSWRRAVAFVAILVFGPIILLAACSIKDRTINNYRAEKFAEQLFTYPLPKNAILIKKEYSVRLFVGNGNHCDYLADIYLASSLSKEEMEEYYSSIDLKPFPKDEWPAYILVSEVGSSRYLVRAIDAPNPPGWDFRCH